MRAFLGFLLLAYVYADKHSTVNHYYGQNANEVTGLITLTDPGACELPTEHTARRLSLFNLVDKSFEDLTGVGLVEDDNPDTVDAWDFSVDQSGVDGIPEEMIDNDFAEIKRRIKEAIPCPADTIEVTRLYTLTSELLQAHHQTGPGRRKLTDILSHVRRGLINVPTAKSYVDDISEARDQAQAGSCASFSTDALFQYYEFRDNGNRQLFSPKFFYYHRCMNYPSTDNTSPCGGGMVAQYIGDLVTMIGNVKEEDCPYVNVNDNDYEETIDDATRTKALELIPDYTKADGTYDTWMCFYPDGYGTLDDFKLAMMAQLDLYGPMLMAAYVYSHTGCDIWNSHGGRKMGGHAMVVIAYDEDGPLIRNSWSTDWGENGHCPMTWNDAYERLLELCQWQKPLEGREAFCDDTPGFTDWLGGSCEEYKTNGWCENCQNGPGWENDNGWRDSSKSFKEYADENCNKSCGCCNGPSMDDVVISDDENPEPEPQPEPVNPEPQPEPEEEDVEPEPQPEPVRPEPEEDDVEPEPQPEPVRPEPENDDNTPFSDMDITCQCSYSDNRGSGAAQAAEAAVGTVPGIAFADAETADYLGYAAAVALGSVFTSAVVYFYGTKKLSDTYVSLIENEI